MKFGKFGLNEATGGVLAHSVRLSSGKVLRKGILLQEEQIELLRQDWVETVHVALLEAGDVKEDEAAARIAALFADPSLVLETASTGRVNVHAARSGLFSVAESAVKAINGIDPGITLATLGNHEVVEKGRLVASLKVIPDALQGEVVEQCERLSLSGEIKVLGFQQKRVSLIQTVLGGTKTSVLEKTRRTLEARLDTLSSCITDERRVEHSLEAISKAIEEASESSDLVIIFGASAISDIRDLIPAALSHSGGQIVRFGMPVDPGNLLLLGTLGNVPVIGAPGCARGPAENGFDWVLQQVVAGIDCDQIDIAGMGIGGLLMETASRPHPRQPTTRPERRVGIVLAAGLSRRMGQDNKMVQQLNGKPLVRHVVEEALSSNLDEVVVVTGHEEALIKSALDGLEIVFVQNTDFKNGLSTSIAAGIGHVNEYASHGVILLGDMPFVDANAINEILAQSKTSPRHIVIASNRGKQGNPVLWPHSFFGELSGLVGDVGAKHLINQYSDDVIAVEIGDAAAIDLDTPEAIAAAQNQILGP